MYSQFFGTFLLNKGLITNEQLVHILKQIDDTSTIKIETLAIHSGYLTSGEVDDIHILETRSQKSFEEIAVEQGYLNAEQLGKLKQMRKREYLLISQFLVDHNILDVKTIDDAMLEYQSEYEIYDLSISEEKQEVVNALMKTFCGQLETSHVSEVCNYVSLFFNDLIRFIGSDFTPLSFDKVPEYASKTCSSQSIIGKNGLTIKSYIDMSSTTAISFANRYMDDSLDSADEYVFAALDDFLNLHNGIYIVSLSNEFGDNMSLDPPENKNDALIIPDSEAYLIVVLFPFGYVNFYFSISSENE